MPDDPPFSRIGHAVPANKSFIHERSLAVEMHGRNVNDLTILLFAIVASKPS
jgi:hypothetical protein